MRQLLVLLCFGLPVIVVAQTPSAAVKTASQSGLDLSAIDKSADPCTDFYQYACGTWMKNHPIPPDQSRWGTFNELQDRNNEILREIAEDAEKHRDRSATDQKIGDFYGSCMAEEHINKLGDAPIKPELGRIASISSKAGLVDEVARLHAQQVKAFFVFDSTPDPDNASMTIAELDQSGLSLPERDY